MKVVKVLFICHVIAIILGLTGLLVMLPHPQLWDTTASGIAVFRFSMTYMGSLYILFGASTMFLFGWLFVGPRKTLIFFCAATLISLSMELLGTSTGFPFGPYAYTSLLGYKIFGHVPFPIPLSWFYMGFTSYLLASLLVARTQWRRKTFWSLLLGMYFLTIWDLSLDPSMASTHLPVQFWIWYETGPYFGMPIRNLVGWSITGLTYMSVSRLFWRGNVETKNIAAWLPFGIYTANTCFAIVLTLGAGIWQPSIMAVVLGLFPAMLVLRRPQGPDQTGNPRKSMFKRISHQFMHRGGSLIANKQVSNEVVGLEHLPQSGPVLLVARHFHHLYDGCLLLKFVPRHLHILVALDWIQRRFLRRLMEDFCRAVDWPIVLRKERLAPTSEQAMPSAYQPGEVIHYTHQASALVIKLLRQGETLVIFPEAYPNIDPASTRRESTTAFLPFRPGFARLLEMAERDGQTHVAIVPVGLDYTWQKRWHSTVRFGPALFRRDFASAAQLVRAIEQSVQQLSGREIMSETGSTSLQTQV